MCRIDAVILAAGLSERMGTNKLLLPLGNSTVISQFLGQFPFAQFENVIVIYHDQQVADIARTFPLSLSHNDNPRAGKSHSIKLGLAATNSLNGILFAVADQPLLKPDSISRLIDTFCDNLQRIVLPEVNGSLANPVIFPAELRSELQEMEEDQGGRELIRRYPERILSVPCVSEHEFYDIDTLAMYQTVVALWNQEN